MLSADTIVFLGPTMSTAEARRHLDALYRPPAAQGDVVRAVLEHAPSAIVIIDGAFAQQPAVRHKEILWAMAGGVRVYGASSMGAIRAAELHDYGMIGHGFVFRWYRRTVLADDDDVAVPMAPPEVGSYALGDALIDVRLTLKRAQREGVIGGAVRTHLEQRARSLHYLERTYPNILSSIRGDRKSEGLVDKFNTWLTNGIVQQKRSDAIGLLEYLSSSDQSLRDVNKEREFEMTDAFAFDLEYADLFNRIFTK